MTIQRLTNEACALLFTEAHTANAWKNKEVSNDLLKEVYNLMKLAPTEANTCPLRVIFVQSKSAKEKLKPCLSTGNIEKAMSAPVTAIFAQDMMFYEHMPRLFPHNPAARSWYEGDDAAIRHAAFLNSSLQAGYFMLAARGLGLDCGPMGGFDAEKLDAAFFPEGRYKSNFLCNLGYADPAGTKPRAPRLDFEEVCDIL